MAWTWDKRTQLMHDLARTRPECGLDGAPTDQLRTYEDEITATTVLKTQHLVPCRFCYRPMGRTRFEG